MRIELTEDWVIKLSREPESGMGYQRVRVRTNGQDFESVVYNCEILEVPDHIDLSDSTEIDDIEVIK